jgi:predicted nuclease of predicted toxin-antitoxin system
MNSFQIVVDESVDYSVVTKLRKEGFNIYSIADEQPSLSDKNVLSIASENNALLITEDKDWGTCL